MSIFTKKSAYLDVCSCIPEPSDPNNKTFLPVHLCLVKSFFAEESKALIQKSFVFKNLSAVFRTELLQMDTLRVLNYDDMSVVLIDYGNTTSCSSLECAVIASMLLDQEWLVSAHVSKIGDVFLIEARLIESSTGRVINAVSYDYDLSIEGLYTRGMHNLSDLVMSKRIPLEIHKRQNLVYFIIILAQILTSL